MTSGFSPVFLLCSERSGSNLIIRILDSHPEFCGPPPSHLVRTLALNLSRFGDVLASDSDWRTLVDISVRIMQSQLGVWRSQWSAESLYGLTRERSVRGIISAVYQTEAAAHGKQFCIIKENRIHLFLPYLLMAFPEARYVWLVRDPRDMALSWKRSPNHPGDVRRGAIVWQEDQERFRQIFGYLRDSGRIHRLRYEDLVQSAEITLVSLCRFLGVDYNPAMLDFHGKEDTRLNAARIANWENLARPLMAENTGKYLEDLSIEEIAYIESLCGEEMIAHGYTLTAKPRLLAECRRAMDAKHGEEDLQLKPLALDMAEENIRKARQQVIDYINSLPVRFVK